MESQSERNDKELDEPLFAHEELDGVWEKIFGIILTIGIFVMIVVVIYAIMESVN